jgi:hypothetical protein
MQLSKRINNICQKEQMMFIKKNKYYLSKRANDVYQKE